MVVSNSRDMIDFKRDLQSLHDAKVFISHFSIVQKRTFTASVFSVCLHCRSFKYSKRAIRFRSLSILTRQNSRQTNRGTRVYEWRRETRLRTIQTVGKRRRMFVTLR